MCADGQQIIGIDSYECKDLPLNMAINIKTWRDEENDEIVIINWEQIMGDSIIKDFNIYIKDNQVRCKEDIQTKLLDNTCSVSMSVLRTEPFNLNYGMEI